MGLNGNGEAAKFGESTEVKSPSDSAVRRQVGVTRHLGLIAVEKDSVEIGPGCPLMRKGGKEGRP